MEKLLNKIKGLSKKNKIVAGVSSVIIVVVIITGVVMLTNKSADKVELTKDVFIFEYGEQVDLGTIDLLKSDDEELISESVYVLKINNEKGKDYPAVGTYKGRVVYDKDWTKKSASSYKGNKYFNFEVKVKDTKAPTFEDFKDKVEVVKKFEGDLASNFKAKDLSEVKITVDVKGVDFNVAGEYKAKVTATDKYKNKTTKEFTIVVGDKTQAEIDADKQKVEEQATQEQQVIEQQSQQSGSASSNNQSGSTTGTGGGNTTPNGGTSSGGGTCSFAGWQMVGNSGYANHDWATADAWADANWPSSYSGYGIYTTKDNCGRTGWTVEWEK